MSSRVHKLENLDRCGNAACLDFINTVHSRLEENSYQYLQSYSDLLQWASGGGLLNPELAGTLQRAGQESPRLAEKALTSALQLRETIYRIFRSMVGQELPSRQDLEHFNEWLSRVLARRRVSLVGDALEWAWESAPAALERPLWPVVLSAAGLLAEGDQGRIKECPSPQGCGWIFLDTSKNGARKWCNMRTCGNLAKARRFYRRHRKGQTLKSE